MNEPWTIEPDSLEWTDEQTGIRCHVHRNSGGLNLCGYVEIAEGHPLYGVNYNEDVPEAFKPMLEVVMNSPIGKRSAMDVLCAALGSFKTGILFDVHGSITFSGAAYWADRTGFWYGFDCAHAGDLSPGHKYLGADPNAVYRDIEYVKAECASLAKQIKAIAAGSGTPCAWSTVQTAR